ncbi:MAG: dockerin type I domain-containing protein, partial [Planctomycetota bacterium]
KVFKDNRIPPRGFTNAAFESFGGGHVGYSYPDGQYWDDAYYDIPSGAASAEVTLYYQSTSKELVEFLRDENTTNSKGQELYDLWNNNGKCPPEVMQTATIQLAGPACPADLDGDGAVGVTDFLVLIGVWGPCPDPPDPCPADLDGDGAVGVTDFLVLIGVWGPCP